MIRGTSLSVLALVCAWGVTSCSEAGDPEAETIPVDSHSPATAPSSSGSTDDTGDPTATGDRSPETTAVTQPTPVTSVPVTAPATTTGPVTSPTAMVQTLSLEFEACERFAMTAIAADLAAAGGYVGAQSTLVRPDGFANVSLHVLQCRDLVTDGQSHGPGYFATLFIAVDEPVSPPSLPEGSGLVAEPSDYFVPVLFHTDNQTFRDANVAFGVPMTEAASTTFDPAVAGLQTGSAVDNNVAIPVAYRWSVENSTWVEKPPERAVHTFVGPSLDDETMIYYGAFSHAAGWLANPATLTLDPGSGFTDLLGERVSGRANGTPVTIDMLAFRQPPPPSADALSPEFPIEYAPGMRLRYLSPVECSGPLRPAIVTTGSYHNQWDLIDRGVALFDTDIERSQVPGSGTFDEEFVSEIALASAELGIAVRWVRAHAAEYCVAPDAVVVAGYSWGAITSLALAYSQNEVQPLDEIVIDELGPPVVAPRATVIAVPPALAGYSDVPSAVISHAGFALPDTIDPGEPPAFLVHGTNDDVIPFALAQKTCTAAAAAGVVCELLTHEKGHGFDGSPTVQLTIEFLNRRMLAPAGLVLLP